MNKSRNIAYAYPINRLLIALRTKTETETQTETERKDIEGLFCGTPFFKSLEGKRGGENG